MTTAPTHHGDPTMKFIDTSTLNLTGRGHVVREVPYTAEQADLLSVDPRVDAVEYWDDEVVYRGGAWGNEWHPRPSCWTVRLLGREPEREPRHRHDPRR